MKHLCHWCWNICSGAGGEHETAELLLYKEFKNREETL